MAQEIKFKGYNFESKELYDFDMWIPWEHEDEHGNTWYTKKMVIMEYTGLLDIYDGFLLDITFGDKNNPSGMHKNVEVYWNEDLLQYCVRGGNIISSMAITLTGYVNPEYTVVGHIYED